MKINWIRTNDIFRQIINQPEHKTETYIEKIVTPWQAMMQMFTQGGDDPLAGARGWNWLLPDQLHSTPPILEALEAANAWEIGADAMHKAVAAFDGHALPVDEFEGWLMLADPARSDSIGQGYTGAVDWMNPRFVVQYSEVTPRNIRALPGAIVHEMNHLVRLRIFPWDMMNTSVADYIIHEGVAESFAAQLFGEDVIGHYVTDFDDSQIERAKSLVREGLDKTGFDIIRAYIFGDEVGEKYNLPQIGMPNYGGYAIGYRVVQAFIQRTGKTAADATFTPAKDIIEQSGYFD